MRNPVTAADGVTYERAAIEDWFQRSASSPVTNEPLLHKHLQPHMGVRGAVMRLGL
jgi:hypothetical protein